MLCYICLQCNAALRARFSPKHCFRPLTRCCYRFRVQCDVEWRRTQSHAPLRSFVWAALLLINQTVALETKDWKSLFLIKHTTQMTTQTKKVILINEPFKFRLLLNVYSLQWAGTSLVPYTATCNLFYNDYMLFSSVRVTVCSWQDIITTCNYLSLFCYTFVL